MSNWESKLTLEERRMVEDARQFAGGSPVENPSTPALLYTMAKLAGLLDAAETQPERRPELFTGSIDVRGEVDPQRVSAAVEKLLARAHRG